MVALDLRGYGASEKPPEKEDYRLEVLLEDIRQVIEILGTSKGQEEATEATGTAAESPKCILVGHDWGGVLAWELAAGHPSMVEKLVIMDAPHRAVMAGNGGGVVAFWGQGGTFGAGWGVTSPTVGPRMGGGSRGVAPPVVARHGWHVPPWWHWVASLVAVPTGGISWMCHRVLSLVALSSGAISHGDVIKCHLIKCHLMAVPLGAISSHVIGWHLMAMPLGAISNSHAIGCHL